MRSMLVTATAIATALTLGCDGERAGPTEFVAELTPSVHAPGASVGHGPGNFATHLSGAEEVPPVETSAQGQAKLQLSRDGSQVSFRLNIANIENTLMAHIHMAPPGVNGPIVVWLRPEGPPPQLIPGRFDGPYAVGTFDESRLVGPLAGEPLSALIEAIRAGNAYVNVHTEQFPGGEIRGQIRALN